MQIKDVAQATGLSVYTIRYYEKAGLLDSRFVCRGPNNYRCYDERVIEHLRIIRFGQSAGFTLAEIRHLMQDAIFYGITSEKAYELLEQKRCEIDRKIDALVHVRLVINAKLASVRDELQGSLE